MPILRQLNCLSVAILAAAFLLVTSTQAWAQSKAPRKIHSTEQARVKAAQKEVDQAYFDLYVATDGKSVKAAKNELRDRICRSQNKIARINGELNSVNARRNDMLAEKKRNDERSIFKWTDPIEEGLEKAGTNAAKRQLDRKAKELAARKAGSDLAKRTAAKAAARSVAGKCLGPVGVGFDILEYGGKYLIKDGISDSWKENAQYARKVIAQFQGLRAMFIRNLARDEAKLKKIEKLAKRYYEATLRLEKAEGKTKQATRHAITRREIDEAGDREEFAKERAEKLKEASKRAVIELAPPKKNR